MAERRDFEVHLGTCSACAGDLIRYREILGAVRGLREDLELPPGGFAERVHARIHAEASLRPLLEPSPRWSPDVARLFHDPRIHVAAASLGGALVGATAIAVLWWRRARRVIGAPNVPL